jgi:hypothetical protein
MKAENRHYTSKWKKKRKNHLAVKCKVPNCLVCHSKKVLGILDKHTKSQNEKLKYDRYDS